MLHEALPEIYSTHPKLFPITVSDVESIPNYYQCYRTFRRTSNPHAIGILKSDVAVVNRWRVEEEAREQRPNLPMNQHYAQLELLVQPFLRYTSKM